MRPSFRRLLFFSGFFSIFTTLGIVYELGKEALLFFQMPEVNFLDILTKTKWQPHTGEFGIWPLFTATMMTTAIAMLIAIPLGMAVALISVNTLVHESAILETDSGSPGWNSNDRVRIFRSTFMTPLLRGIFVETLVQIYNMAAAAGDGHPDPAPHYLDDRGCLERCPSFLA